MSNGLKLLVYDTYGFGSSKSKKDATTKRFKKVRVPEALPSSDPVPGWTIVHGWQSYAELKQKIAAAVQQNPGKPIELLRFSAHGAPTVCDDVGPGEIADFGSFLKTQPWMDEAKIFLTSCNSGLPHHTWERRTPPGPIAKHLADAMPFDPGNFAHKITVYGSRGYAWGSLTGGTTKCTKILADVTWTFRTIPIGQINGRPYAIKVPWPVVNVTHSAYPNAVDASGDDMWNKFKNGTW